jgi:Flp pilus assembly protein TadD
MIITDRFVFIHLHKTGGQSLNDAITRCLPNHKVVGYHLPRSEVPPGSRGLPIVGLVRNPWDWYISWYAFNKKPQIRNPLFNIVSDGGSGSFKATVTNLINLGAEHGERRRKDLISLLPDSLDGNRGVGLTKASILELAACSGGYYSWLFGRMLGREADDQTLIGRFENLQEDFLAIMRQLDVGEAAALQETLQQRQRKNVSRHSHYSHYYDDELRDLVARRDRSLIERFDYHFASVKPPGLSYEFPADTYTNAPQRFRKLLSREDNFLQLRSDFDVTSLREKVEQIPAEQWLKSERERLFAVHKDTQSLKLVHFEDYKFQKPEYQALYSELKDEVRPVVEYIADYYRNNGFIVRMILAKLLAGGKIPNHTDAGFSLLNCHRIHVPIITNEKVVISVGGEEINMRTGDFWEINNATVHGVENHSAEDRIHLIVDWMPNYEHKPEEEVLAPDQLEGAERIAATEEMLTTMVQRAYQLGRSGDLVKAESLYRQVLNFDENHVVANNLLGLLCIQAQRPGEAVSLIEKALAVSPKDAQAHANLGIAYRNINQLDAAATHFRESLKLDPGKVGPCNNLGGVYMVLGHFHEAATCFKQALSIQPGLADVHFNLGNALVQLHQYDEAIQNLQHCLRLRPGFAEAQAILSQAQQRATDG